MEQAASGKRHAARGKASRATAALATLNAWQRRVRSHAFWVKVTRPHAIWQATLFLFGWIYTLVVKLPWVIVVVVIGAIVIQGLFEHATVIDPISVPKALADRGYTSEVAGRRLRDAVAKYISKVHLASRQSPEIALHGDLPSIVVPTIGISLDAIVSSICTLLRSTRSRSMGGEITADGNKLWLRLRLDGREFYASQTGADLDKPDDLFTAAVQDVVAVIGPSFVAVTLSRQDPDRALAFVNETIAKLPVSDEELPWLYNARGMIFRRRGDIPAAIDLVQAALKLNGRLAASHIDLGVIYIDQRKNEAAAEEFRKATALEPNLALAHNDYAAALNLLHQYQEAEAEIDKALKLDKNLPYAHDTRGEILRDAGRREEAIAEFKEALRLKPDYATALRHLNALLAAQPATGALPDTAKKN